MIVNKIQTQIVVTVTVVVLFFLASAVNVIDSQYMNILAYREQALIKQKNKLKFHIIFSLFSELYHSYELGELTEEEAKMR